MISTCEPEYFNHTDLKMNGVIEDLKPETFTAYNEPPKVTTSQNTTLVRKKTKKERTKMAKKPKKKGK